MHSCKRTHALAHLLPSPALFKQPERSAKQGMRSDRAEADDSPWLYSRQFRVQPLAARGLFFRVRALMHAPFAALLKLEMFDDISQVYIFPRNAGIGQCPVEHLAGRAHEREAALVFRIARLFADEHDSRMRRTFAKNRLGRGSPQITGVAIARGGAQRTQAGFLASLTCFSRRAFACCHRTGAVSSRDRILQAQVAPHQIWIGADGGYRGSQLAASDAENATPPIQLIGLADIDRLNNMTIRVVRVMA